MSFEVRTLTTWFMFYFLAQCEGSRYEYDRCGKVVAARGIGIWWCRMRVPKVALRNVRMHLYTYSDHKYFYDFSYLLSADPPWRRRAKWLHPS